MYDPERKWQLRLAGPCQALTTGPVVDRAWEGSSPSSRRCYLALRPPSAPTLDRAPSANLPGEYEHRVPSIEASEAGRANFAVLRCRVERADWLTLAASGHGRAGFTRDPGEPGGWRMTWLEP